MTVSLCESMTVPLCPRSWSELFSGKSSIYALDEVSKEWVDRGISGLLTLWRHSEYGEDVRICWAKGPQCLWWRLLNGRLKAKGERAWVLKAWDIGSNAQEIVAIRFSDVNLSLEFSVKFKLIFPDSRWSSQGQGRGQGRGRGRGRGQGQGQGLGQWQQPSVWGQNGDGMGCSGPLLGALWGSGSSTTSSWECAVCTYSNDALSSSCIMCGLSRDNGPSKKGPAPLPLALPRPHSSSLSASSAKKDSLGDAMASGKGQQFTFPNKVGADALSVYRILNHSLSFSLSLCHRRRWSKFMRRSLRLP